MYDADPEPSASLEVLLGEYCRVVRVLSASTAIAILQNEVPALVVAGLGVAEFERQCFLNALNGLHGQCPIIVMAPRADAGAIASLTRFPITAVYRKPVPIGRLVGSVGAVLCAGPDWPRIGLPVGRAVDYISQQYAGDLTVESVARTAGISPSRLAHLFQQQLRSSVKRHISRVRIEIAKQFLENSGDTLEEIAGRVGCWDASHLSRLFLRFTRGRPSHYRQAHARRPAERHDSPPAPLTKFAGQQERPSLQEIRALTS